MDIKIDVMMVEVLSQLGTIQSVHVLVHHRKTAAPFLVALRQFIVRSAEYIIDEGEIVFDLFVALDMEAVRPLLDRGCAI